jgi:hypothetical protein
MGNHAFSFRFIFYFNFFYPSRLVLKFVNLRSFMFSRIACGLLLCSSYTFVLFFFNLLVMFFSFFFVFFFLFRFC